jgi:hypothetical protein
MFGQTARHVAIWLDHHQATLLIFEASSLPLSTVEGPEGEWFEYCVDGSQYPLAQDYYEAVLSPLEPQDEIFVLGPDQAKRELLQRIEGHRGAKGTVVGVHDASRLSEVDLVYPTDEVRHAGDEDGGRAAAVIRKSASQMPGRRGRLP